MRVVRNKILITAVLALVGSALALTGGNVRSPVTIAGLILVALSPVISLVIVYLWYGRRWSVRSKEGSSHA